jgi:hypothetical protein
MTTNMLGRVQLGEPNATIATERAARRLHRQHVAPVSAIDLQVVPESIRTKYQLDVVYRPPSGCPCKYEAVCGLRKQAHLWLVCETPNFYDLSLLADLISRFEEENKLEGSDFSLSQLADFLGEFEDE